MTKIAARSIGYQKPFESLCKHRDRDRDLYRDLDKTNTETKTETETAFFQTRIGLVKCCVGIGSFSQSIIHYLAIIFKGNEGIYRRSVKS